MKLFLLRTRDSLRNSFWFVPLLMALIAAGGAFGSVALDHRIGAAWVRDMTWIWAGGPDGARSVLSTVAGSLMTVISIVFSLTITTLAQTSSHFGPRALRNFTSHRGVQLTLGTFISTFIFCLLVLRTVRSAEESLFVPYLSVNIGMLLTLASLGVLIFFIHHIAQSIQAETLTADVGRSVLRGIPSAGQSMRARDSERERTEVPEIDWKKSAPVTSAVTGYVQNVDDDALCRLASQRGATIRLCARAGDFLWRDAVLLDVVPSAAVDDAFLRATRAAFNIGGHRTPHQDATYSIQQLVEIALHGLSPGINEPFTALNAVDWLGAALAQFAALEPIDEWRRDAQGVPRVLAPALDFDDLLSAAFDQTRTYGRHNIDVMLRLLDVVVGLAPHVRRVQDLDALHRQANLIASDAHHVGNADDQQRVLIRHRTGLELLRERRSSVYGGGA